MIQPAASLPRVFLNRAQWIRLVIVGILVVFALARVVPDLTRAVYPLHVFDYVTDGDGIVVTSRPPEPSPSPATKERSQKTPSAPSRRGAPRATSAVSKPQPAQELRVGDRLRIDRIKAFDRKPGLAEVGFTYDNPERQLPVERGGRLRTLHLSAREESPASRFFAVLRIVLFTVAVGLGAILFLIKPGVATAAFFLFCLAGEAPTTYVDIIVPNPWRAAPEWIGNTLRGAGRPALLLFAFCLIDGDTDAPRERIFAYVCGIAGLVLGTAHAYGEWLLTYAARPAERIGRGYTNASDVITAFTTIAFVIAFARARGLERRRIAWIVLAFLFANGARLISDAYFPRYIPIWLNGVLLSTTIVPIVVVWIAVVRQRFFNVDFVVSRAMVYTATSAAVIGTLAISEEFGTYLFYNNTDFAYGFIMLFSMIIGATFGRITTFLTHIVDRFIFRDRRDQRKALELIEGYILDAETLDDVYRALLADAAHALQLSFGGFLARTAEGDFVLSYEHNWPTDCITRLTATEELTRALTRTRGALTFEGKDTAIVARAFPNERLTFAAPIFFDRSVLGIVMYGHNVSGLDLDPEEREHLVRVVAHASIALSSIELARYRSGAAFELPIAREVRAV